MPIYLILSLFLTGAAGCRAQEMPNHDRPASAATPEQESVTRSPHVQLDLASCASVPDGESCLRDRERSLIARVPGVTRIGDTLIFATERGVPAMLVDSIDGHGVGWQYLYAGSVEPGNAHLAVLRLYEGGGYVLVSRATGRITGLDAAPVSSPDGSRFVTASADTEAGYDPNRLQVFRFDGDSVVLEWQIEPATWGPIGPRWVDDATLEVIRRPAFFEADSARLQAPLVLRRVGTSWVADTAAPPAPLPFAATAIDPEGIGAARAGMSLGEIRSALEADLTRLRHSAKDEMREYAAFPGYSHPGLWFPIAPGDSVFLAGRYEGQGEYGETSEFNGDARIMMVMVELRR